MRAPGGERIVVALDALGAESGPRAVVAAVAQAAEEGIGVRVFGRSRDLEGLSGIEGIEVLDTDDAIGNDEEPVGAVRGRPEASIVRAAADVADGPAHALVSPGSTGATLAASLFALKRIRGVQRPALAVQIPAPARERPLLMLDVGANAEARPSHLVGFAHLGAAFAEAVLGVSEPRVALLSVGAEAKKGTPLVVEAHAALADSSELAFAGNVEGSGLLDPAADVIVTDGFTGNVVLKTIEGTALAVGGAVRSAARSGPRAAAGGVLLRPALGTLRERMNPDGTGGAILLGLRGVCVVTHGSAGSAGIANAIRLAARTVAERATERTAARVEASGLARRRRDGGTAGSVPSES